VVVSSGSGGNWTLDLQFKDRTGFVEIFKYFVLHDFLGKVFLTHTLFVYIVGWAYRLIS